MTSLSYIKVMSLRYKKVISQRYPKVISLQKVSIPLTGPYDGHVMRYVLGSWHSCEEAFVQKVSIPLAGPYGHVMR